MDPRNQTVMTNTGSLEPIVLDRDVLADIVRPFIERRNMFLDAAEKNGTPLYLFEPGALIKDADKFRTSFEKRFTSIRFFFAVKSNNYPEISRILASRGFGLDVSSGEELRQALNSKAESIIFSGPGKTDDELEAAVRHHQNITILIDSFGELERLGKIAQGAGLPINAGVRLTTDEQGLWRKFGIPLSELGRFIAAASIYKHVIFRGIQFHTSWSLSPDNQVLFLGRLGEELKRLDQKDRDKIRFVDIGGGYWPAQGEWLHPWALSDDECPAPGNEPAGDVITHYCRPAMAISDFAARLADAVKKNLASLSNYTIFVEPGRWICNEAMHVLLKVIDRKDKDLVIADGGTNIIGWERFETDYFPVINLSRPGTVERRCYILGALCTPHDVWGYSYFGNGIEPGDILLIPFQGAYTYSLQQRFIKPLPRIVSV